VPTRPRRPTTCWRSGIDTSSGRRRRGEIGVRRMRTTSVCSLLMGSSRPGTMAANLQGIWNEDFTPPWDSKYTTNINVEMDYWPAEVGNLPETTHTPDSIR
jgi:alpha-L-fucosidase 2